MAGKTNGLFSIEKKHLQILFAMFSAIIADANDMLPDFLRLFFLKKFSCSFELTIAS